MSDVRATMARSEELRALLDLVSEVGGDLPAFDDDMAAAVLLVCVVNGIPSIAEEGDTCTPSQRDEVKRHMIACVRSAMRLFDHLWQEAAHIH